MAKPLTALQIARCGHIAALLREEMAKRGWTARHLCEALGLAGTSTAPYPWINGTSAPSVKWQAKLSETLGHPVICFAPRDVDAARPTAVLVAKPTPPRPLPVQPPRPPVPTSEVLSFKV